MLRFKRRRPRETFLPLTAKGLKNKAKLASVRYTAWNDFLASFASSSRATGGQRPYAPAWPKTPNRGFAPAAFFWPSLRFGPLPRLGSASGGHRSGLIAVQEEFAASSRQVLTPYGIAGPGRASAASKVLYPHEANSRRVPAYFC